MIGFAFLLACSTSAWAHATPDSIDGKELVPTTTRRKVLGQWLLSIAPKMRRIHSENFATRNRRTNAVRLQFGGRGGGQAFAVGTQVQAKKDISVFAGSVAVKAGTSGRVVEPDAQCTKDRLIRVDWDRRDDGASDYIRTYPDFLEMQADCPDFCHGFAQQAGWPETCLQSEGKCDGCKECQGESGGMRGASRGAESRGSQFNSPGLGREGQSGGMRGAPPGAASRGSQFSSPGLGREGQSGGMREVPPAAASRGSQFNSPGLGREGQGNRDGTRGASRDTLGRESPGSSSGPTTQARRSNDGFEDFGGPSRGRGGEARRSNDGFEDLSYGGSASRGPGAPSRSPPRGGEASRSPPRGGEASRNNNGISDFEDFGASSRGSSSRGGGSGGQAVQVGDRVRCRDGPTDKWMEGVVESVGAGGSADVKPDGWSMAITFDEVERL